LIDEGTERAILSALAKWQEAIKIDPDDSTALCGLSQCYCEIALRGIPQSSAAISHANQAAERASQLDSDLPIVLACRGTGYALSWNWREAETCFKQALEFGDNPGMYRQYAVCLAGLGRFREAWAFIQKAQQIDPFSYRQKVIYTRLLYLSRNYENGMRYLSEQLLYGRLPNEAEVYRAMMLISHNRLDEARQIAKDLSEKSDAEACIMSGVAEILARCGDSPAATRIVDDYRLFTSVSPISRFRQALLLVGLRDPERAIVVLTEACEQRDAELIWLACDPRLDGIREDIRFKCLQDRVMCNCSSPFQG
jgi:tetratricopeptide (TPR) repeat protein